MTIINALYALDDGPRSIKDGYFGNIYQASSFKRGDREYEDSVYKEAEGYEDSGQRGGALIADRIHGPLRLFGRQVGERFDLSSRPIMQEYQDKLARYLEAYEIMVEVSGDYHLNIPDPLTKAWLDEMMHHPSMNEGRREVLEKVTPAFFEDLKTFLDSLEKELHDYVTIRFKLDDNRSILIRNETLLNPELPMSYPAHALFSMRYVGEAMIDRNEVPDHVFEWLNRAVHQENSITDTIKNLFATIFKEANHQHGLSPEEVLPYLPPVLSGNMMKTIRQNDRNLRMLHLYHQVTGELPQEELSRLEALRNLAFREQEQPPLTIQNLENNQEAGVLLYALTKRLKRDGAIEASSADRL